jgi:DNA-binding CsgD family transcriptional regulator
MEACDRDTEFDESTQHSIHVIELTGGKLWLAPRFLFMEPSVFAWEEYNSELLWERSDALQSRSALEGIANTFVQHIENVVQEKAKSVRLERAKSSSTETETSRKGDMSEASDQSLWDQIDHKRVAPRLKEISDQMCVLISADWALIRWKHREKSNSSAITTLRLEAQEKRTDEWLEASYSIYCDVWRAQGKKKSPAFLRAVYQRLIVPLIDARIGPALHEVDHYEIHSKCFNQVAADIRAEHFRTQMAQLEERWRQRLETEASKCECEGVLTVPPNVPQPTRAPKPPTPLRGGGSRYRPTPKPTVMPNLQPYLPHEMIFPVTRILTSALREFPTQTRVRELCEAVIVQVTPEYCDAVRNNSVRIDTALSSARSLLEHMIIANCDYRNGIQIEQEVLRSDAWAALLEGFDVARRTTHSESGDINQNQSSTLVPVTKKPKKRKDIDLSRYLDAAGLTGRQLECYSLKTEYGLTVTEIARRIKISRKTVDQHIASAQKKMSLSAYKEKIKAKVAQTRPDEQ